MNCTRIEKLISQCEECKYFANIVFEMKSNNRISINRIFRKLNKIMRTHYYKYTIIGKENNKHYQCGHIDPTLNLSIIKLLNSRSMLHAIIYGCSKDISKRLLEYLFIHFYEDDLKLLNSRVNRAPAELRLVLKLILNRITSTEYEYGLCKLDNTGAVWVNTKKI